MRQAQRAPPIPEATDHQRPRSLMMAAQASAGATGLGGLALLELYHTWGDNAEKTTPFRTELAERHKWFSKPCNASAVFDHERSHGRELST